MTVHTEYPLRSAGISKVLNLPLAISTLETIRAEGLIAGENGQILNLVSTATATICAVVADQGAVA